MIVSRVISASETFFVEYSWWQFPRSERREGGLHMLDNRLSLMVLAILTAAGLAWSEEAVRPSSPDQAAGENQELGKKGPSEANEKGPVGLSIPDRDSGPYMPQNGDTPGKGARRVQELGDASELVWPGHGAGGAAEPDPASSARSLLQAMSRSEDASTRRHALEGLSAVRDPKAGETLLDGLLDESAEVRRSAAAALMEAPEEVAFAGVMEVLTTGTPEAIGTVEEALPRLKPTLEARMLGLLFEESETAARRAAAAFSLGRMRSTESLRALVDLAWTGEPPLGYYSAEALAYMAEPSTLQDFADLLSHQDPAIRWAAIVGLGRVGGPRAIEELSRVVLTPDEKRSVNRREAVAILGRIGGPAIVPVLITGMAVPDPGVRREAGAALRRLTGAQLRDEPGLWQAWYAEQRALAQQYEQPPPLLPAPTEPEPGMDIQPWYAEEE